MNILYMNSIVNKIKNVPVLLCEILQEFEDNIVVSWFWKVEV